MGNIMYFCANWVKVESCQHVFLGIIQRAYKISSLTLLKLPNLKGTKRRCSNVNRQMGLCVSCRNSCIRFFLQDWLSNLIPELLLLLFLLSSPTFIISEGKHKSNLQDLIQWHCNTCDHGFQYLSNNFKTYH